MDRVFAASLYANWYIPQNSRAIVPYTLNAILKTEKRVLNKLLQDFLSPLSLKDAEKKLAIARELHLRYLPKDKQPDINAENMQDLWESVQGQIMYFFYETILRNDDDDYPPDGGFLAPEQLEHLYNLIDSPEFPQEELIKATEVILKTLKSEKLAPLIRERRHLYKNDKDKKSAERVREIDIVVDEAVLAGVKDASEKSTNLGLHERIYEAIQTIYSPHTRS
jgi:hypothetical protein